MAYPLVSVVIPTFNTERYLVDAVQSALNQSYKKLEVLVVDDGSTDSTTHAIAKVQDTRLRLISQRNQGQSAAINTGVKRVRGDFIKLLDADDFLNPLHIESQLDAIDADPTVVASCRWGYFVDDPERPATRQEATNRDYDNPLEWLVDSLTLDEGMMGGWMWLIPRALWDRAGGYDARLSLNNDFHFSIRLLLASSGVRFADKAVYSYRKGVSSALSGSAGRRAMVSAFLTTQLGTDLLLQRENSPRMRRICADRFQMWLYRFFPEYADLAAKAERRIAELGGSELELTGGLALKVLKPLVGWRGVRRLQAAAYKAGWQSVLELKAKRRVKRIGRESGPFHPRREVR